MTSALEEAPGSEMHLFGEVVDMDHAMTQKRKLVSHVAVCLMEEGWEGVAVGERGVGMI